MGVHEAVNRIEMKKEMKTKDGKKKHLDGVRGQVDVSPIQVGSAGNLAPLLAGSQGFQHRLGQGKGAVRHADSAKLADDVASSCQVKTR